jgi:hypothetical protein
MNYLGHLSPNLNQQADPFASSTSNPMPNATYYWLQDQCKQLMVIMAM